MGAPPSSPPGCVGIRRLVDVRDPWNLEKTVATVYLKNMSISTSGKCEKFFRAESKIYAHTVYLLMGYGSVIDSEAWAEPHSVNGRRWAAGRKLKDFRICFCEDRRDQPCAWLQ